MNQSTGLERGSKTYHLLHARVQWPPCLELTDQVAELDDAVLDSVSAIWQRHHVAWSYDVHVVERNVLSRVKLFIHSLPKGRPSGPPYEIRGYDQPHIAQQLILHGRVARWCLLHNLLLVDVVGPPSAEICRIVANFPQVDDLRFINLREAYDEDGSLKKPFNQITKSLLCPQHTQ